MVRLITLVACSALVTSSGSLRAADDAVLATLDAAKAAFEKETLEVEKTAKNWFDEQEARARRTGERQSVQTVQQDREKFQVTGTLPKTAPRSIVRKQLIAINRMELAYENAMREYVRLSKDQEAAGIEKELKIFREKPRASDDRLVWKHPKGQFKQVEKGVWEEGFSDNSTRFRYQEIARNDEYIEFDALNGNTNVRMRLYDKRCDRAVKPKLVFDTIYSGAWSY